MRSLVRAPKENRVSAPGPFRNRPDRNSDPGGGSSGGETPGGRAGRRKGIRLSDRIINGILVLALTIGICMLLYPTVSNYWNSFHQTQLIEKYSQEVSSIDAEEYERILDEARRYNAQIAEKGIDWRLTDEKRAVYERTLNPFGNGMMGYIKIPKIGVELPIFHGTKGMTMETAVGHMEQSSLPIGGAGSHCMLAGHRGLMSVMIFTHLDELQEGDTFTLRELPVHDFEKDGYSVQGYDFSLASGKHDFPDEVCIRLPRTEEDGDLVQFMSKNPDTGENERLYHKISGDGKSYLVYTTHFSQGVKLTKSGLGEKLKQNIAAGDIGDSLTRDALSAFFYHDVDFDNILMTEVNYSRDDLWKKVNNSTYLPLARDMTEAMVKASEGSSTDIEISGLLLYDDETVRQIVGGLDAGANTGTLVAETVKALSS